jgi:hypothetical protein
MWDFWRARPSRRWEDNIKMDLQEVGWRETEWIDLAQDNNRLRALVNAAMNLHVSIKCGGISWLAEVPLA